ncbi:hypothetical protein DVH05_009825 [Phytophthora capsici]|nr:hypothetical protein DVH05_009825 [Phytophthora capsici]
MDPQTAEAGETYLNSMGFRSLIEWMTAEALLSRPDDPLTFLQSLLQEKIGEKTPIVLLTRCLTRPPPPPGKAPDSPRGNDPALVHRLSKMEQVIQACRIIGSELNPMEG